MLLHCHPNPELFFLFRYRSVWIFMAACPNHLFKGGGPIPEIIAAKDLNKKFGDITAVDNISFTVKKGEVFGFLGPNGAGKTSTMKIIACVSPRTSGNLPGLWHGSGYPSCRDQTTARGCSSGDKSRSGFYLLWKPVHLFTLL